MKHSNRTPHFPENLEDYAPWVAKYGLYAPYGKCQCGCGQDTNLAPDSRLPRGLKKDEPYRCVVGHKSLYNVQPAEERFWEKVDKGAASACWEWTAAINSGGYGSFGIRADNGESQVIGAHRYSYSLHYGSIPDDLHVLHLCDNPACVNPAHLWLGTREDNMQDCRDKGRLHHVDIRGEEHKSSKLTSDEVKEIRNLYKTGKFIQADLAEQFDVGDATISRIVNRKSWKHIK